MASTQTVLSDNQIITQSKDFVADVMGDDAVQREGGVRVRIRFRVRV
jgi:hypothetical protein